jgi:hypothetical protein
MGRKRDGTHLVPTGTVNRIRASFLTIQFPSCVEEKYCDSVKRPIPVLFYITNQCSP